MNHPYEIRTRVFAVKGRCLNHLTNGCTRKRAGGFAPTIPLNPHEVHYYYATHCMLRSLHKTKQAFPVYSTSVRLGPYLKLNGDTRH